MPSRVFCQRKVAEGIGDHLVAQPAGAFWAAHRCRGTLVSGAMATPLGPSSFVPPRMYSVSTCVSDDIIGLFTSHGGGGHYVGDTGTSYFQQVGAFWEVHRCRGTTVSGAMATPLKSARAASFLLECTQLVPVSLTVMYMLVLCAMRQEALFCFIKFYSLPICGYIKCVSRTRCVVFIHSY